MLNRKHRMYFVAFAAVGLISIVLALFYGDVISRPLASRALPSSTSPAPSATVAKERPMSQALIAYKPAQPPKNFILTSERFVKNTNTTPDKTNDGK